MSARVAVHSLSASLGPIPKQLIYCSACARPLTAMGVDSGVATGYDTAVVATGCDGGVQVNGFSTATVGDGERRAK